MLPFSLLEPIPPSIWPFPTSPLSPLETAQNRPRFPPPGSGKTGIRRVELTPNGIVLNPFDGDPIMGEVKEREGARSGRWRFIDVEWLN